MEEFFPRKIVWFDEPMTGPGKEEEGEEAIIVLSIGLFL